MNIESSHLSPLRRLVNKVPEVTLFFWLVKMMSTTVGETAADFLNENLNFGLEATSAIMGALFLAALAAQVRARRHIPWLYWLTVLLVSVFGTLITDNLSDNLNVPLSASTCFFSIFLIITFGVWYRREGTLSIHHIDSVPRELFYWLAILATFSLGTAAGDWFSEGLGLGYMASTIIFAAGIAIIAAAYYLLNANAVLCFWLAYILTRPLGASVGDLLSHSNDSGGLGFSVTDVNAVFLLAILGLVLHMTVSQKRSERVRCAIEPGE